MGREHNNGRALLLVCALAVGAAGVAHAAAEHDEPSTNWWSFRPAKKPAVPLVDSNWPRNEIDRFILQKRTSTRGDSGGSTVRQFNSATSPEADRRTVLRRVTFNLTGLPPTPEELAAFLSDPATNAYEKVVDRLLGSPRYGERWARHWLDAVHYGESHGYDKDKPRLNAWPYRDYVIQAFNRDKPYIRFIEEQLAADALFPDRPELIPALGFIAAGPWDFVGHVELPITKTDGLIARYNDRDDIVMNTMSTFQSLTVHCARCHDHKFDPISQRDYYSLQAVFAGVDRADRAYDADPELGKRRKRMATELAQLSNERKQLEAEVARLGGGELRELEKQIAGSKRVPAAENTAFGYHSQIAPAQDVEKWVQLDLRTNTVIQAITFVGCHDDFNNIGAGFGFPVRYKVECSDDPEFKTGVRVLSDRTRTDVPNPGVEPQQIRTNASARHIRFTATKLAPRKNDYIFALAEVMVFDMDGENRASSATITALDSIEASPRWRKQNLIDGYYVGAEPKVAAIGGLQARRDALLGRVVPDRVRSKIAANEQKTKQLQDEIKSLGKANTVYAAVNDFPENGGFVPAAQPRAVHLLRRGDVKRAGEAMQAGAVSTVPGAPAKFHLDDPDNEGLRRAALAKWITDTNNMLTRRSLVNRIWAHHFGAGIVDTPNDFGRMGGTPSHPELLDWLAFWFLENGESMKKLHRLIVTSATYQQVATGTAERSGDGAVDKRAALTKMDANNRLLWRMNSSRLDAEQFHDALLSISGKLDLTMGGPSVQQFAFKDDHSPVYDYARYDLDTPGVNRRSIYRFIVRSVPDPFLDALDCPDANTLTPVRNVTTTALQALATLNDAFVLRQCKNIAARLERERNNIPSRIERLYELALNRKPSTRERDRLSAHAENHGLASACRVLLNSNEFMFVD